ncbi:glycine zipper 2TM domain-containing protein [Candidatus Parabeggiatoa sp. HSG14]|uniref:glycine zipper 2TM domain-containing protein n=1 Tax=Candidatus Parabeggiatoa sp. HSG14 TaxID=3055593 RepID=UPI0025A83BC0|nr:glycine zipper 2TM domain-containing protein [Thiotrichales bacterium HSG14]
MQIVKIIIAISITTLLFSGCMTSRSTNVYSDTQSLQAEDVEGGIVESVEAATIRQDGTIIGSAGGAILGGIGGSTIGGGTGKELASVAGVIIGGLLGHYIEQGVTDKGALKIVVRLDSGEKIVVVQEDDVAFQPGEKINVFSSRTDNTKRVSKIIGFSTPPGGTPIPPSSSTTLPEIPPTQ